MLQSILGIGVDIEGIERFRSMEIVENMVLLEKIFTAGELGYCQSFADPAPHLAARYAAKESIFKALTAAGIVVNELSKIETLNDKQGIPHAVIHHKGVDNLQIHISLSHHLENAIAFAIVTQSV